MTVTTVLGTLFYLVIWPFIHAIFLLWGAKISKIPSSGYGKALGTSYLSILSGIVLSLIFSIIPVIGTAVGSLVSILVAALIMMGIFKTNYGKSLLATVLASLMSLVFTVIVVLIVIVILGAAGVTFAPVLTDYFYQLTS